jgi:alkylation response protein AidB-like acyl-CoA dehydrogenase
MAALTEEQALLRESAIAWVRQTSPLASLRRQRENGATIGYDPDLWQEMSELGWAGVIVPEAFGGSGLDCAALRILIEETSRALTASPLTMSAFVGASALILGAAPPAQAMWLPRIADGSAIATLAVDEGLRHAPEQVATIAKRTPQGFVLDGHKRFVPEGSSANLFIVSARVISEDGTDLGVELFLVPANARGTLLRPIRLVDNRGAAHVEFDKVAINRDAKLQGGETLLERLLDRARAGVVAEMLGMAEQAFQTTVEYLKSRVQFGQPIGAFQALQHRAAYMFTQIELARSTVEAVIAALDADSPDVPELASIAKVKMGETLFLVSNEMIQLHGGIGMTDAHDAGLYLKRARVLEASWGNRAFHRDRFARIKGF